ncbi:MAG: hypothetical protein Phog2KO_13760 [Phototrophicaceae bacterium]
MTIKVKWLVENRILLAEFSEEIDSEQIIDYLDKSMAMRDTANEANAAAETTGRNSALVHTITDGNGVTKQSVNLKTIREIMKSLRQQRIGWSIYVSENQLDRFVSSMAHQFGGIRYRAFATMDEALEFLRSTQPELEEILDKPLDFTF